MRDRYVALIVACALVLAVPAAQPAGAQQAPPAPTPAPGMKVPSAPTLGPIPTIPPVPTLAPHPLTLADALTAALQNNFQTRQAGLAVAIARAQLREAEAQKAVTLGGSASFTDNSACCGGAPVSGTISIPSASITNAPFTATGFGGTAATNSVFALTLKYPLYTGGALEAQIAIARANELIAEAQFAAAAEQVVFSVRQAYYSVTASEANVVSAQHSVDAARENVRVAAARVQVGTSPQFDLLQAQVQLAQSAQALTQARTALSQSQQNLAATLVLPLPTTVVPAEFSGLPEVPQDVDALIQQAVERRPEVAAARASEVGAQAAINLAASGLAPNITIQAGPQIQTSDPTSRDPVNFTGTITLTLAILDGGLTQAKVEEARSRLQSAKVTEEQTRQQVELDVRNAYLSLGNAADVLRSALAGQTAAREALRIANVRFQAGVGTQLEVVTAVQNLATADTNVTQAVFQYYVALAQLDRAIGVQVKI
jgi:OMF family outer membrane factor